AGHADRGGQLEEVSTLHIHILLFCGRIFELKPYRNGKVKQKSKNKDRRCVTKYANLKRR
ncbi:hypothetical protein ACS0TV_29640, partial [Klebsiella pneumoniae]